ncbi:uncharacterized protein [Aegilops tauschii subsp. strangulata]|uniref:uncharacterized protein isoform X2 n=1 Tax=Aegilops tauschii subsp. strangulata TaxID=200361 RepID=UPI003CC8C27F
MKKIKTYYMCALAPLPVQGRWRCLPAPPVHCCRTATGLVEDIEPEQAELNEHWIPRSIPRFLSTGCERPFMLALPGNGTTMYKEKRSKANCTCRKKNQARVKNTSSKEFIPGGSKLLMVCQISYFEFLIITRFKLPTIEPRLPLWSTNMLNSYVALNVLHGKSNEYSRLLDKIILQMKAQEFYRNIIWNSTPTLKTYVDDMHSSFLKIGTSSSNPNLQFKSAISKNTFKVPRTKQLLAIQSPPNCPMLHVPTIIDEDKRVTIDEIFQELVNDFPRSIIYIYIFP